MCIGERVEKIGIYAKDSWVNHFECILVEIYYFSSSNVLQWKMKGWWMKKIIMILNCGAREKFWEFSGMYQRQIILDEIKSVCTPRSTNNKA